MGICYYNECSSSTPDQDRHFFSLTSSHFSDRPWIPWRTREIVNFWCDNRKTWLSVVVWNSYILGHSLLVLPEACYFYLQRASDLENLKFVITTNNSIACRLLSVSTLFSSTQSVICSLGRMADLLCGNMLASLFGEGGCQFWCYCLRVAFLRWGIHLNFHPLKRLCLS